MKGRRVQSFYFPFFFLCLPGSWLGLFSSITTTPIGEPFSLGHWVLVTPLPILAFLDLRDDNGFLLLVAMGAS